MSPFSNPHLRLPFSPSLPSSLQMEWDLYMVGRRGSCVIEGLSRLLGIATLVLLLAAMVALPFGGFEQTRAMFPMIQRGAVLCITGWTALALTGVVWTLFILAAACVSTLIDCIPLLYKTPPKAPPSPPASIFAAAAPTDDRKELDDVFSV